jgi:hypothetical protein
MSFVVLDIPDQPAELAPWLERHLVGLELADVIAGIEALGGRSANGTTLAQLLGDRRAAVLERGLSALSREQLQALLRQPRRLLELQELVLRDGGAYWRNLPLSADHRRIVDNAWTVVESGLSSAPQPATASAPGGIAQRRVPWAAFSIAAALLIGLFGWWQFQQSRGPTSGWGFDKPGVLAAEMPARDYLNSLADAAGEWFNKHPSRVEGLTKRLTEFRHGCDTLLAAPHPQLAAADREWLLDRCRVWAGKLDGHIADLNSGKDLETVRGEADATINKLIAALRERAGMVA